jgi:hypothetical protein
MLNVVEIIALFHVASDPCATWVHLQVAVADTMSSDGLSHGQLTFFLGFAATAFLYVVAEALHYLKGSAIYVSSVESAESAVEAAYKKDESLPLLERPTSPAPVPSTSTMHSVSESGLVKCLTLDRVALQEHRGTLKAMVEMGCLMCLYYLCDRTTVFQTSQKDYSRDVFLFMFLILTCVAYGSSRQQFKMPLLLNRPQTEEWKGWMQVGLTCHGHHRACSMQANWLAPAAYRLDTAHLLAIIDKCSMQSGRFPLPAGMCIDKCGQIERDCTWLLHSEAVVWQQSRKR